MTFKINSDCRVNVCVTQEGADILNKLNVEKNYGKEYWELERTDYEDYDYYGCWFSDLTKIFKDAYNYFHYIEFYDE